MYPASIKTLRLTLMGMSFLRAMIFLASDEGRGSDLNSG